MKNLILFLLMLFSIVSYGQATSKDKPTGETITKSGETHKVYVGAKGGKYIYRTSKKTGKVYKQYLPKTVSLLYKQRLIFHA